MVRLVIDVCKFLIRTHICEMKAFDGVYAGWNVIMTASVNIGFGSAFCLCYEMFKFRKNGKKS